MYKDNAINRRLGRVGMKYGATCPKWEEPEEKKPKVKAIIVKKKKKFVFKPKEEPKKEEPKKEEPKPKKEETKEKFAQEIAELKAFSKQQKKIKKAMMTKPPKEEPPKIEKTPKDEKLVQKHSKDPKQKVFWDRGIRDIIFGKKKTINRRREEKI